MFCCYHCDNSLSAFGESWVSYYWHCPTAMSFNTSLVGSKRAVCSGQSGTFVPADLQCNQLCQPITNYKILPVTGGAHPLDYNQPATSVLTITCAPNTTLVPSLNTSVITTCSNGIWQPEVPPCEGTCPSLNILGGVVRGNLFAGPVQPSTTAVVISCLANRSIDETGNQSMELTCNGTLNKWEPYEPTCQLSCTLPVIPHSIINQTVNQFLSGTEIEILCSENHTVNGTVATETVVKCENNYWTPGLPKCLAKCDKLEIGQAELFGGIDIRDVAQLSTTTVNVTCWENFTIDGTPANNLEIQCDDGSWRPEVPRCLQICEGFCVTDSSINSGNGNCVSQQLSTAVAIVDCATHYLINNSTRPQLSLTCDNGTWSHPIPTCLPMCPSIDVNAATIAGGDNPQVDWQPFDTQLTVKCWEEGEFTLSCMDSIWNPVVPLCDG